MKKNKFGGFTLIELLIVVAIISILMTIGINSFNKLQINARDAKRKSDLSIIQSALEQYHADQHYYPLSITSGSAIEEGTKKYMSSVPSATGAVAYLYEGLPSSCDNSTTLCVKYCIYAALENSGSSVDISSCTDKSGYNYEAMSP